MSTSKNAASPRPCPHPLYDTSLKDATSLQFHFVDEHGFSRVCAGKPANPHSQDEKIPIDMEDKGDRPSRKRKSSNNTGVLEWMPAQFFGNTPVTY
jgi:hypothetical protein